MPEQGDNIHVPPIYTFTQEAQGRINSSVLWTEAHLQNGIPPVPTRNARPGVEVMWGKMDAEVVAFDASAEEVSSGTMTIWDLNVEEAPYTFAATSNTVDVHNLTLNTLAADTMIQVHRDPKTDKWFYNAAAAAGSFQLLRLTEDMGYTTTGYASAELQQRDSSLAISAVSDDNTYKVKDELNAFKYSLDEAYGYGYLIKTEDNESDEYQTLTYAPILFETRCQLFTAKLYAAIAPEDDIAAETLTNIKPIGSFPFTQIPDPAPEVKNADRFALATDADKKVLVGWNATSEDWELLAVGPVCQKFVTDVQLDTTGDAPKLQMKRRKAYIIPGGDEDTTWTDIFTATECPE